MLEETPDRRSQRTRAALHAAFVELLLEQGYDALKIGAVSERANVGRSTFYEHFRTKHDLLRASIVKPFSVLADLAGPAPSLDAVAALLGHFRSNQQVARVLLGCPTRPLLAQALASLLAERLRQRPRPPASMPVEVLARQIADAQLSLVESWVLGRPGFERGQAARGLLRSSVALADMPLDAG